MKSRKLNLRREAVTDLRPDELRGVAAAASGVLCQPALTPRLTELSVNDCVSLPLTDCTILQETQSVTCPTDLC